MTLIANEIYLIDGFKDSFIISIADSRLTYQKEKNPKKKYLTRNKLFDIKYLNSTVSFWGATLLINERNKNVLLCDWLPTFITKNSDVMTLLEFSQKLRIELNQRMYKEFLSV